MIYLLCGDIRKGKTALMTYLSIMNTFDGSKAAKRAEKLRELKQENFIILNENNAFYADYKIKYVRKEKTLAESLVIVPQDIGSGVFLKPYSTLCIQEFQSIFGSRNWQHFGLSSFFQMSGHFGIDIFIDCQNPRTVELNVRSIAKIIEVNKMTAYNAAHHPSDNVKKKNFSEIVWDVTEFENIRLYEERKGGEKKVYKSNFNIFDCYNPYEKYRSFLPPDKSKPIS